MPSKEGWGRGFHAEKTVTELLLRQYAVKIQLLILALLHSSEELETE